MGDGRHRQDPGGHGRFLVAVAGALIVLALLATGGYALYSVLATEPPQQQSESAGPAHTRREKPAQRASVVREAPSGALSGETTPSAPPGRFPTLDLRVTGSHSYVSVRGPDGAVLLNEVLRRGERARFHQGTLRVTVGKPAAVRVTVDGEPKESTALGIDTFTVSRSR